MYTRRRFLELTGEISLTPWFAACGAAQLTTCGGESEPAPRPPFLHGVASGDPLADAVILWTRVTPQMPGGAGASTDVDVEWLIGTESDLTAPAFRGTVRTGADTDYTVKIDVRGLAAGTSYYYRFRAGGVESPIGRTRTLPVGGLERLRIAVTSCANYPQGFFHAYRKIAERSDLDVVLYLGDYLYEFGNGGFGDGSPIGRVPEPDREITTLEDYRVRHAQYKTDSDLQAVHRQHPCIAIWDDHELADNAYRDGANNHQPGIEGDWRTRKQNAVRAYHEWMPIRPQPEPERIYRSFAFGDLADLVMLDTRLIGRDPQILDGCDVEMVRDPARSLLGVDQKAWLEERLMSSRARGARWRLIGQQVSFSELRANPPTMGCISGTDKWNGYESSRRLALDTFERAGGNIVILTGDAHSSWGADVPRHPFDPSDYDPTTGKGSLAVELVVPGVSSPGIQDSAEATRSEEYYLTTHPHVKFAEQHSQGYLVVDLSHEWMRAEWYYVTSVREPEAAERLGGVVETRAGENHLQVRTERKS